MPFPINMQSKPAGGYAHHSTYQNMCQVPTKGTGMYATPKGMTSTTIRPLTNKDYGNVFPTGFGLPRPLKQYRKGIVIPIQASTDNVDLNGSIDYNLNRAVASSTSSLSMVAQLMDRPGATIIKQNTIDGQSQTNSEPQFDCQTCNGVGIVSDWMPVRSLTVTPQANVTNPLLCCNDQRKARRMCLPSNTNLPKNYYQTNYMKLYNRCQTFDQRQFDFIVGKADPDTLALLKSYPGVTAKMLELAKPGSPLSLGNYYVAQCNPNFTIEKAVELDYIQQISQQLVNAGYIQPDTYNVLTKDLSMVQFIHQLQQLLTKEQYDMVILYLYQLAANPYNGSVVAGPSNPKGCSQVFYKPNNPQYAQQGAVSSSTRMLKLNVDTISTAAYKQNRYKKNKNTSINASTSGVVDMATALQTGFNPNLPFLYKDKVPPCQPSTYIGNPYFFQGQHQNKWICKANAQVNSHMPSMYNSVYQHSAGNYIGSTLP